MLMTLAKVLDFGVRHIFCIASPKMLDGFTLAPLEE